MANKSAAVSDLPVVRVDAVDFDPPYVVDPELVGQEGRVIWFDAHGAWLTVEFPDLIRVATLPTAVCTYVSGGA